MSASTSPDGFASDLGAGFETAPAFSPDEGLAVRFPPGLGIIPPRELSRVPRPRRNGELLA